MVVTINKSIANGVIQAPPSKSYAHRLLICAALSNSDTLVYNVNLSKDIIATINCLRTLGYIVQIDNDIVNIKKDSKTLEDTLIFNCGESGSTLRFMIPIALTTGKKIIFKGSKRLIERGILPYIEIFNKCGIDIIKDEVSITFIGKLKTGNYEIVGDVSSQFISGLLFALPLLDEPSTLTVTTNLESKNYIDMTIDAMAKSKVIIEKENNTYKINPSKYYHSDFIVEGDYSNASFLDAFNYLGGSVKINGLNLNSYQGDKVYKEYFELLDKGFSTIDLSNCIDLGPILFCFASLKHGGHFINTKRLKIKESDRIKDIKVELEKFGIELIEKENEVIINNNNIHKPNCILNGQNDHRIIMALSVMLSVYGGSISGYDAVDKSYPNYFSDLSKLNIEVIYND